MTLASLCLSLVIAATSLVVSEPEDGAIYDGDWLTLRTIVENENVLPDSVHFTLNGGGEVQIPRLNTDWTTYMQGNLHHGYSESPGPQDATILWTAPVCGFSHEFCNPVIVDGVVYFQSDGQSILYALDAATGAEVWQYDVVDSVDDAVTYFDGKIFACADSTWCFDALTGQRIWAFGWTAGSYFSGSPVIGDDVVYVAGCIGSQTKLFKLDIDTGVEQVSREVPHHFEGCGTLYEGMLFMPFYQGPLFAFDPVTLDTIWTNTLSGGGYWDSSPVVKDDILYIGCSDGYLRALNTGDGTLVWETKIHQFSHAWGVEPTPAIHDGRVFVGCSFYGGSEFGIVGAFSMESGTELWSILDIIELHGSIGLADGLAYFGEHRGDSMYAVDQITGEIVWSYGIPGGTDPGFQGTPAITDGVMYMPATDGNLYAFGTGLKYTYRDDLIADVGSNTLIATSFMNGSAVAADTISFTVTGTGIGPEAVSAFQLTAFPNPFRSMVTLSLEIAEPGHTLMEVYDLSGRKVRSLLDSELAHGTQSFTWDGCGEGGEVLSSGVYFCVVRCGENMFTTEICLLR